MTDSTQSSQPDSERTLNPQDINYALSLLSAEGDTRPSFKAGLLSVVSYMLFGISFTSFIASKPGIGGYPIVSTSCRI